MYRFPSPGEMRICSIYRLATTCTGTALPSVLPWAGAARADIEENSVIELHKPRKPDTRGFLRTVFYEGRVRNT